MSQLQRRLVARIKDFADRRGVVLSHLPKEAGVARSHFFDVITLKKSPTLSWLERVAAALKVDVARLLAPLDDEVAFARVEGTDDERYKTALPLITLADAVTGLATAENVIWVAPKSKRKLKKSMFVSQMLGRAMEPVLPGRAFAIFDTHAHDLLNGRLVLAHHRDISDPESGQRYAVRRWTRVAGMVELQAENPAFAPFVFSPHEAKQITVVAEIIEVLPFD